ncbi:methyltransferase family protein [Diaphorobacter aerolatus]|uniref:Isoprenylcysteine carboxylmethyltransferase family protein n=1 Tax=Diaphorobacter aerolatus TaxID=1288495 RepID=A0A7H0GHF5_9BURK|nr:isoprenylcysteine carboxylmethyltransferase family protein [Diaphorobacter aerolatus]QNP47721.1 isoprenylcysteine carboxylmethyltransferase family protein [Diaphorobacter aerolatus]
MSALDLRIPPPIIGLATAALMYGLAVAIPSAAWSHALCPWLAGGFALVGIAIDLSALWAFHRHRTTVNPLSPDRTTRIVSDGIYRLTRNPMYLGMLGLLLAWAIWLANMAAWVGPVLFVAYITRFQIIPEERILHQKFGAAYAQYRQRVRRWI